MITSRQRNKIYDAVHKAWVYTCISVTAVTSVYIGYQLYHYFTKVKPIKHEMEERFKEELLKEGRMAREKAEALSD